MIRVFILLLISQSVGASDLGIIGQSFPVKERSFLSLIEERLAKFSDKDSLEAIQNQWLKRVSAHTRRPKPSLVRRAAKTRTHSYRPEFTASRNIFDSQGQVIVRSGTRVNALEKLPYYKPQWLFINEDDIAQIRFAKHYLRNTPNAKLIFTGGDIKRGEERFDREVYFDQEGKIVAKLSIDSLPAFVRRKKNALLITEVAIKESGDEV